MAVGKQKPADFPESAYLIIDEIQAAYRDQSESKVRFAFAAEFYLRVGEIPDAQDLDDYLAAYLTLWSEGVMDARFVNRHAHPLGGDDWQEFLRAVFFALESTPRPEHFVVQKGFAEGGRSISVFSQPELDYCIVFYRQ